MRAVLLLVLVVLAGGPAAGQADKKKDDKKKDDKKAVRREPKLDGRTIAAWAKSLEEGDAGDKLKAALALMQAGPEARPALPGLMKLLAKPEPLVMAFALPVLSRIGADAVPPLHSA
jgi:hypothetical protein